MKDGNYLSLRIKKNADSTDSILLLLLQVYNVREKKRGTYSLRWKKELLATYTQAQIISKRHFTGLAKGKDGVKLNRC